MGHKEMSVTNELLHVPFLRYSIFTVSLPSLSLAYCFISAILFAHPSEINDTDCKVVNTIPSVSAVTGVKPQAYVWRMCIGLHSFPRFLVGIMYYNYYKNSLPFIQKNRQGLYKFLMNLCFWLYTIECTCLLAVSCISNKENYSVHEKIFVVFMVTSIAEMLFGTILYRWSRYKPMTDREKRSYFWKKMMFAWISLSTAGLLYFFVQHRVYCVPGAFSIFSIFEYMIAYANMGYHLTGYLEFYGFSLIAGVCQQDSVKNGSTKPVGNGSTKPVENGSTKPVENGSIKPVGNGSTKPVRHSRRNGRNKAD